MKKPYIFNGLRWLGRKLLWFIDHQKEIRRTKNTAYEILSKLKFKDTKNLTKRELMIASKLVVPTKVSVSYEEIGGLSHVIDDITKNVIIPAHKNKHEKTLTPNSPKGILFYGPHGCGKTMISEAITKEEGIYCLKLDARLPLFYRECGSNMSSNNIEKMVDALFSLAQKMQPFIIFIDHFEEFTRSEHYNYFENKWLHTENNLIIIGETNHIFWRNERFEMLLKKKLIQSHHITLPDTIQRREILATRMKFHNYKCQGCIHDLAIKTSGFSGDDLDMIFSNLIRNKYEGGYYIVTMDSLLESANKIREYMVKTENIYTVSEDYIVLGQPTKKTALEIHSELKFQDTKNLTERELMIASKLVDPTTISVSYEEIGGLSHVINDIRKNVIIPAHKNKHEKTLTPNSPKGILFHGPHGCGKTMISEAITKEEGIYCLKLDSRLPLFYRECGSNMSSNNIEKMVDALFSLAQKMQPFIIFIDHFEEFTRSEHYNYFENKWLHTENNLIIIGETNHIFWRNERFEMLLKKKLIQSHHITLPDKNQREEILATLMEFHVYKCQGSLNDLAIKTSGFSGYDLDMIFSNLIRNKYEGGYYIVTMDSLLESADKIRKYKVNTENIYTVSEDYRVLSQSTKKTAYEILSKLKFQDTKNLTERELMIASKLVVPTKVSVSYEEIGGLSHVINDIRKNVIIPAHKNKHEKTLTPNSPKGILFHGPHGCGKTMISEAITKEEGIYCLKLDARLPLFYRECGSNMSSNNIEKMVDALFSLAQKMQPFIIFIDHFEEFTRSEHYNYFENKWLHTENNLIIIGETNHIFWRNEPFEMLLKKELIQSHHISLPDTNQRREILATRMKFHNYKCQGCLHDLAIETSGFSGDDLDMIFSNLIRDKYEGGYYIVTMDSLLESANRIRKYMVYTENIYTVSEGYFVLGQSTLHQNIFLFYCYH
ncbi:unnamed protein product [Aphis gossypii]|uniref:AAA+ ATPase domain-containing protein n=1 Tax=Aphis gossypii TaxID=80765 RepID=A0A9P0IPT4_APHGO|nr:unnamed protein product [Aphis gossypii]